MPSIAVTVVKRCNTAALGRLLLPLLLVLSCKMLLLVAPTVGAGSCP
jgi:hypothetical protein